MHFPGRFIQKMIRRLIWCTYFSAISLGGCTSVRVESEGVPDISFQDGEGCLGKLSDYQDRKALVIAFNQVDCTLCNKFAPSLIALEREYRAKGVEFLIVNANSKFSPDEVKAGIRRLGLPFRYIPDSTIAKRLHARTTTEVFVLNSRREIVFRGPVSDQFGLNHARNVAKHEYLREALDAVIAGKTPPQSLPAPGCVLDFNSHETPRSEVTFYGRISRILQQKCQQCHRPGGVGPMPLVDPSDMEKHAAMIAYMVSHRFMPPWFANPNVGKWSNDRSLSDADRSDLIAWLESGMPLGNPLDAPAPRKWTRGWEFGEPDRVFRIPHAIQIPRTGFLPYQYAVVDTQLEKDVWLESLEIQTRHPEALHHIVILTTQDPKFVPQGLPDLTRYLVARVPGNSGIQLPSGKGKKLLKGTRLIFHIHYTSTGKAIEDRPALGVRFSRSPVQHEVITSAISREDFEIPAGESNYALTGTFTFDKGAKLNGFFPHMHGRGKAFRYDIIYPDERQVTVLDIPRYDFNWQIYYQLKEPLLLPPNSVLKVTAWYDNSDRNPNNPDPSRNVHFGWKPTDEMMIGNFDWEVAPSALF